MFSLSARPERQAVRSVEYSFAADKTAVDIAAGKAAADIAADQAVVDIAADQAAVDIAADRAVDKTAVDIAAARAAVGKNNFAAARAADTEAHLAAVPVVAEPRRRSTMLRSLSRLIHYQRRARRI